MYDAVPHSVKCDRQMRLAQLLMAAELSVAEFGSLQTIISATSLEKVTHPRRITITVDALSPARSVLTYYEDKFASIQDKKNGIDLTKPLFTPKNGEGASIVAKCIDSTFAMLLAGDDTLSLEANQNDDKTLMEPTCVDVFIEKLSMIMYTGDEHKTVVKGLIEKASVLENEISETRKLIAAKTTPDSGDLSKTQSLTPEEINEISTLVERINTLQSGHDAIQDALIKNVQDGYFERLNNQRLAFFDPSCYRMVGMHGSHALLEDSMMRGDHDGENPMWALSMLGAMVSDDGLSVRLVYHGDQEWSDLLRPPKEVLWASDEKLAQAEVVYPDEERYDPAEFMDRLVEGRKKALDYYREHANKTLVINKEQSEEHLIKPTNFEPAVATAAPTEASFIPRFPAEPTIVQFCLPFAKIADFFHGIAQIRAAHQIDRRLALKNKHPTKA